ncbi:Zinc-regulated transporter 2 [Fusarium oxysporum f. sp. albedinis]|nr:Zinc-regulated transporter 2 [Fusarium oxysporum f. sp. albedinis]
MARESPVPKGSSQVPGLAPSRVPLAMKLDAKFGIIGMQLVHFFRNVHRKVGFRSSDETAAPEIDAPRVRQSPLNLKSLACSFGYKFPTFLPHKLLFLSPRQHRLLRHDPNDVPKPSFQSTNLSFTST